MTTNRLSKKAKSLGTFEECDIDIKEEPIDENTDVKFGQVAEGETKSNSNAEDITRSKFSTETIVDKQAIKQDCDIDSNIKIKEEEASSDEFEEQENLIEFIAVKEEPLEENTDFSKQPNENDILQTVENSSNVSNTKKRQLKPPDNTSKRKREELRCQICFRKFSVQRSLDKHLEISHSVVNKKSLTHNSLPKQALDKMRSWFNEHLENPYPTYKEKLQFCIGTNLTLTNVNDWFINARRRYLQKPKEKTESSTYQLTTIKTEDATNSVAENFIQATSDNLPEINSWMVAEFISKKRYFIAAEIRSARDFSSQHDSCIGFVELCRENNICTIQCKICTEHNENKHYYTVTLDVDEEHNNVISVTCMNCDESIGGCKHVIMFLMWLNKKTEEPKPTTVEFYWREPKLTNAATEQKFLTLKDFGAVDLIPPADGKSFLEETVKALMLNEKCSNVPLVQCFREKTAVEMLDLYLILLNFVEDFVNDFLKYASSYMNAELCREASELCKEQYKSDFWYKLRYARVSCSKIYDVAHCQTKDEVIIEQIFGSYKFKDTKALAQERTLKSKIIKVVEKKFNIQCKRTGLLLNKNHPVLVATPDAISEECVVEIKYPTGDKLVTRYVTAANKISDKYNGQIQLQMYLAGKKKGIFCVADPDFENNETVIIIIVDFDELFIMHLIKNAEDFWKEYVLPLLLNTVKTINKIIDLYVSI